MTSTDIYLYIVKSDRKGIVLTNAQKPNDDIVINGRPLGSTETIQVDITRDLLAAGWQDLGETWGGQESDGVTYLCGSAQRLFALPVPVGAVCTVLRVDDGDDGSIVSIHSTQASANAALLVYVASNWPDRMSGEAQPADAHAAITAYFSRHTREFWSVEPFTVID